MDNGVCMFQTDARASFLTRSRSHSPWVGFVGDDLGYLHSADQVDDQTIVYSMQSCFEEGSTLLPSENLWAQPSLLENSRGPTTNFRMNTWHYNNCLQDRQLTL